MKLHGAKPGEYWLLIRVPAVPLARGPSQLALPLESDARTVILMGLAARTVSQPLARWVGRCL